jgi:hypothetical protein
VTCSWWYVEIHSFSLSHTDSIGLRSGEHGGQAITGIRAAARAQDDADGTGVGEDQVDIIVQRATGGRTEGTLYDAVKKLTKSLKNPSIIVVAFSMLPIH